MNDTSGRRVSAGRDPTPRAWSRSRPRPNGAREQRWKNEGDGGQSRREAGSGLKEKKTLPPELAELAAFRAAEVRLRLRLRRLCALGLGGTWNSWVEDVMVWDGVE